MRKLLTIICLLFGMTMPLLGVGQLHAQVPAASTVLNETAKKISSMPSMTASFSLTEQGKTVAGTITLCGDMFALTTRGLQSSWYNGSTQWVYNPSTEEITITTPTPDELASVNPFVIIKTFQKAYSARQLKAPAGSYVIQLTPNDKKADITSVVVTVNASTKLPTKIVVSTRGAGTATINISSVKSGPKIAASKFAPAKKLYPKAEFIDLR